MSDPLHTLRSHVSGQVWPPLPSAHGATLGALLYQFERSQWLPPAALLARQLEQLGALLGHALRTVPYYRERARAYDAALPAPSGLEDWRHLPTLSRRAVQDAGTALRSEALPAGFGEVGETHTAGSTGEPVRLWQTALERTLWAATTLREHAWHRRDLSARLASIRLFLGEHAVPPEGLVLPNWGAPAALMHDTGPMALLDIGRDVAAQAAWLERIAPDYLMTYPTNLAALLEHAATHGWRLPRLREARTVSETVTPALRARCAEVWGVPLTDVYSSRELGYIALQCPERDVYHVNAETMLVELLDDDDRPVAPGEIGRVVVTPLHAYAAPLLRYELDDFAEAGGPCGCGRGAPTLSRIVGRSRNMQVLPDGTRRWPFLNFAAYRGVAPVRQYQFVQRTLDAIEVRLVTDRPLAAGEEQALARLIGDALGHGYRIDFVYYDGRIPRGPGGKYEEYVTLVGDRPRMNRLSPSK